MHIYDDFDRNLQRFEKASSLEAKPLENQTCFREKMEACYIPTVILVTQAVRGLMRKDALMAGSFCDSGSSTFFNVIAIPLLK